MLRSVAVSEIQEWLGFLTDKDSLIVEALKKTQDDLEGGHELPWFLISEVSSIMTTIGEERVPLPSDFLREFEDGHLWVYDSSATDPEDVWTPLIKLSLDQLRLDYPGSGKPKAYASVGQYWRLGPTPDDNYTLKTIYYAADDVLDSDVENKWLKYAADLMVGEAGYRMAVPLRDADALAAFRDKSVRASNRLLIENIQYEHVNRSLQMGGDD